MSIRTTKSFLREHATLRDHVEHFPVAARELPRLDTAERIDVIERVVAFLAEMLLPHAAAEERVLYPEAARLLGEPDGSDAVAGDRAQVRVLFHAFVATDPDDVGGLQEILFALYALLSSHLWREEELYLKLVSLNERAGAGAILERTTQSEHRGGRFRRALLSGSAVSAR